MEYNLTSARDLRALLEKYGLAPKKGFGQNFLINPDVPYRIAASAACGRDPGYGEVMPCEGGVIEIGPGIGAMTRELSGLFEKVVAVEIDRGLIPLLGETLSDCDNTQVVEADFLSLDLPRFVGEHFGDAPVKVCANLPYYVTTPVLMKILESFPPTGAPRIDSVTVMIQTEVADRLCATENDSEYGAVTASVALHGRAEKLFTVSAGNFFPAPKVSSSVVCIKLHPGGICDVYPDAPSDREECALFIERTKKLISAAFIQRRKTLTNALSGLFPKEKVADALESLGLRVDVRGEKISPEDFCKLTAELY